MPTVCTREELDLDERIFFSGWSGIIRILVVGVLAYVALVLALRTSGSRTLAKMHAYDLVVTVALGSTLATVILSKNVALAEGLTAFVLLIGLQFLITWLTIRSPMVGNLVTAEPVLLFYQGSFLRDQMRRSRVVEDEVRSVTREQGLASLDDVEAVVLESDGTFSVVQRSGGTSSALGDLPRLAQRTVTDAGPR